VNNAESSNKSNLLLVFTSLLILCDSVEGISALWINWLILGLLDSFGRMVERRNSTKIHQTGYT